MAMIPGSDGPSDRLPATRFGPSGSSGPPVVLVHGFTQTRVSWEAVAAELAREHRVVAVDAPGHGNAAAIRVDLEHGAALLGATGERAVYVGYSMGGRLALRLALDRPDLVAGLVLLGATAGIDDADERVARRRADHALADDLEAVGTAAFLDRWLAQPLFAGLEITAADRRARLANEPGGLAASLRLAGTGAMEPPWWDDLATLTVPVLVLAGARDDKFCAVGRRLAAGIGPNARFEAIADAGHAAHLEQPTVVARHLRRFLAGIDAVPGPSVQHDADG